VLDNDSAFEHKLDLIRGARHTLDLAYYIFEDDLSSSVLALELVRAARRGVKVRLLLDYFSNYVRLDFFRALEQAAQGGEGSLDVRFYGRPTDTIIGDAVYMTLSCAVLDLADDLEACAAAKTREVARRMGRARQAGAPPHQPVDYDSGGSGILLSGLYAQKAGFLAHTIVDAQEIDLTAFSSDVPSTPERKEKAIKGAIDFVKLYWRARASNDRLFQQAKARLQLSLAFLTYGNTLNPIFDALSAWLPVRKLEDLDADLRDWNHLTDFLHHKLLLADGQRLVLGGRNIGDPYHMRQNPLVEHYVFADTDVRLDLKQPLPDLVASYERLWGFQPFVATLDQVRRHAPNDVLMATLAADAGCDMKEDSTAGAGPEECRESVFARQLDTLGREQTIRSETQRRAERFVRDYRSATPAERTPDIVLDPGATPYYLENLPFNRWPPGRAPQRIYGSINGQEGRHGKYLHNVWLAGLENTCRSASAERPQRVVLNTAYLLPPSNLMRRIADMVDGTLDCRHVSIDILTNSPQSTDLRVINFFARYALKPLADHYRHHREPARGARVRYFEFLGQGDNKQVSDVSLHSKVTVLGPDLLIGSANMDVRSYMMDTNNGVLLRAISDASRRYLDWFDGMLADTSRIEEKTGWLQRTTLEEMIAEDRKSLAGFFDRQLDKLADGADVPTAPLVDAVESLLRTAHRLTVETLSRGPGAEEAARRFNVLFKLL
jgi:phosphatidylserine/phosphatidylglycerophosphate/cardiolipin synthase-like enzyme